MATYSNVDVRAYDEIAVVKVEVASATVVAKGDLIEYSSAGTVGSVFASQVDYLIGVALEGSESGDTDYIPVATRAKISAYAVDAGYLGDAYHYTAGANGTNWTFTNGTTEGLMWALEDITASAYNLFYLDTHALKGGFLFEAMS